MWSGDILHKIIICTVQLSATTSKQGKMYKKLNKILIIWKIPFGMFIFVMAIFLAILYIHYKLQSMLQSHISFTVLPP